MTSSLVMVKMVCLLTFWVVIPISTAMNDLQSAPTGSSANHTTTATRMTHTQIRATKNHNRHNYTTGFHSNVVGPTDIQLIDVGSDSPQPESTQPIQLPTTNSTKINTTPVNRADAFQQQIKHSHKRMLTGGGSSNHVPLVLSSGRRLSESRTVTNRHNYTSHSNNTHSDVAPLLYIDPPMNGSCLAATNQGDCLTCRNDHDICTESNICCPNCAWFIASSTCQPVDPCAFQTNPSYAEGNIYMNCPSPSDPFDRPFPGYVRVFFEFNITVLSVLWLLFVVLGLVAMFHGDWRPAKAFVICLLMDCFLQVLLYVSWLKWSELVNSVLQSIVFGLICANGIWLMTLCIQEQRAEHQQHELEEPLNPNDLAVE